MSFENVEVNLEYIPPLLSFI